MGIFGMDVEPTLLLDAEIIGLPRTSRRAALGRAPALGLERRPAKTLAQDEIDDPAVGAEAVFQADLRG